MVDATSRIGSPLTPPAVLPAKHGDTAPTFCRTPLPPKPDGMTRLWNRISGGDDESTQQVRSILGKFGSASAGSADFNFYFPWHDGRVGRICQDLGSRGGVRIWLNEGSDLERQLVYIQNGRINKNKSDRIVGSPTELHTALSAAEQALEQFLQQSPEQRALQQAALSSGEHSPAYWTWK